MGLVMPGAAIEAETPRHRVTRWTRLGLLYEPVKSGADLMARAEVTRCWQFSGGPGPSSSALVLFGPGGAPEDAC